MLYIHTVVYNRIFVYRLPAVFFRDCNNDSENDDIFLNF